MTTPAEPLWSDERIDDEVYTDFRHIDSDNCESIVGKMRMVRDDLQSTIDALIAQAQQLQQAARDERAKLAASYGLTTK